MSSHLMFHGSAVTNLTPWSVTEHGAGMPPFVFPFYLGSRMLGLGLDPTGMQGISSRVAEYPPYQSLYGGISRLDDDLFVYHSAMKSNHGTRDTNWHRLPLGWMDYCLVIDGQVYHAAAIAASATDWQRTFDLATMSVETRYHLAQVAVTIRAFVPDASVQPTFLFRLASLDGQAHQVTVRASINCTMRTGEPLFVELPTPWQSADSTGFTFTPALPAGINCYEPYQLTYGLQGGTPVVLPDGLAVETALTIGVDRDACADFVYYFGSSQTATDGDACCQAVLAAPVTFAGHTDAAAKYWAQRATVSTGEAKRDWLYHFSLYLTELGTDTRFGAGCCGNFDVFHLHDAIFWDEFFMMDGLLHAGALSHAEQMVRWLHRVMGKDGKRPFYWMCHYDGTTLCEDTAYTSITAHTMTAIKVWQHTQDAEVRRLCHDIVQYVAAYAVEHFFVKADEGWVLGTPATTDITFTAEFVEGATNNTFTHCWFLTIFATALEMAAEYDGDAQHLAHCREILAGYHLEQCDEEYLDQRDGQGGERWDSYVPMLCYPTEAHRWVDLAKYHTTRIRHDHYCSNLAVTQFKMPWPMCWAAADDLRTGLYDAAEHRLDTATDYAYGPGYLAEGGSEGLLGTTQPYLTATGAYLTAQSEQLFYVDAWTNQLCLFSKLGRQQELHAVAFERVHGRNGLVASGRYTPSTVDITLTGGSGERYDLELLVPYTLRGTAVEVCINGVTVTHERPFHQCEPFIGPDGDRRTGLYAARTVTVHDILLDGTTTIAVRHGREPIEDFSPEQVLIYDFGGLGTGINAILVAAQIPACLTNDFVRFFQTLPTARYAVFTDGVSSLSPNQLRQLEGFVQAGGTLVCCYETGCASHALHHLLGVTVTDVTGNRHGCVTYALGIARTDAAPATFPDGCHFTDTVRFEGEVAPDVTVLYRDEQGAPYCTLRQVGNGMAVWMASGRVHMNRREYLQSVEWRRWCGQLLAAVRTPMATKR